MTEWEEQTRNLKAEYNIQKNRMTDGFEPLFFSECPIDIHEWMTHVQDIISGEVDMDEVGDDEVIAVAKIYEVSYHNDRGEVDVRYEARYDQKV